MIHLCLNFGCLVGWAVVWLVVTLFLPYFEGQWIIHWKVHPRLRSRGCVFLFFLLTNMNDDAVFGWLRWLCMFLLLVMLISEWFGGCNWQYFTSDMFNFNVCSWRLTYILHYVVFNVLHRRRHHAAYIPTSHLTSYANISLSIVFLAKYWYGEWGSICGCGILYQLSYGCRDFVDSWCPCLRMVGWQ